MVSTQTHLQTTLAGLCLDDADRQKHGWREKSIRSPSATAISASLGPRRDNGDEIRCVDRAPSMFRRRVDDPRDDGRQPPRHPAKDARKNPSLVPGPAAAATATKMTTQTEPHPMNAV